MNWLLSRLTEASTWAGIGGLVTAVGQLGHIHEAGQIADTAAHVGVALATGANPIVVGVTALASIAAIFIKDKGAAS